MSNRSTEIFFKRLYFCQFLEPNEKQETNSKKWLNSNKSQQNLEFYSARFKISPEINEHSSQYLFQVSKFGPMHTGPYGPIHNKYVMALLWLAECLPCQVFRFTRTRTHTSLGPEHMIGSGYYAMITAISSVQQTSTPSTYGSKTNFGSF